MVCVITTHTSLVGFPFTSSVPGRLQWSSWVSPRHPHRIAMPLSSDEPVCPKFQPNIFDPSRCQECLRQKHMHASAGHASGAEAQQQISAKEAGDGSTNEVGRGKGVFLTPIPSQTDERDTSSKVGKTSLCEANGCSLRVVAESEDDELWTRTPNTDIMFLLLLLVIFPHKEKEETNAQKIIKDIKNGSVPYYITNTLSMYIWFRCVTESIGRKSLICLILIRAVIFFFTSTYFQVFTMRHWSVLIWTCHVVWDAIWGNRMVSTNRKVVKYWWGKATSRVWLHCEGRLRMRECMPRKTVLFTFRRQHHWDLSGLWRCGHSSQWVDSESIW